MSRKQGEPNTPRIISSKYDPKTYDFVDENGYILKQKFYTYLGKDNKFGKDFLNEMTKYEATKLSGNKMRVGPKFNMLIDKAEDIRREPRRLAEETSAKLSNKNKEQKEKYESKIDKLEKENEELHKKQYSNELEDFIKQAYINRDYQMTKDELAKVYSSPKYKSIIKDADPKDIANRVYEYATTKILKNKKRIKQLAQIGLSDPSLFQNLNPELQREMYEAIEKEHDLNKSKKELKWKLPVDKPRWQKAMVIYKVNPMLARGAYSVGSRK